MRALAFVLLAGLSLSIGAQLKKTVASRSGILLRYSGDTIWSERDSTVNRWIYHRDTVVVVHYLSGVRGSETTWLITGDSARVISQRDSTGPHQPDSRSTLPARFLFSSREGLARELASPSMRFRTLVDSSPATPVSYCIDSVRDIVQHGDTARDIRRHGSRADTTIYVFVEDTTVRRVAPNPATLNYAMYNTLFGEMHMSIVRKSLVERLPDLTRNLSPRSAELLRSHVIIERCRG